MQTVEEHEIVRRVADHLLAQLDSLLSSLDTQKRVPLWRLLRAQREKLLQLCTVVTPSYEVSDLARDLQVVREVESQINALHEWSTTILPSEYTRLWRSQAAPVLNYPLGAHGWNRPENPAAVAARSERCILTALLELRKAPKLVQLVNGEGVLETLVWRMRVTKWNDHWRALSHIELLLEPGIMLPILQEPPLETLADLLMRVWRACAMRCLVHLNASGMPADANLVMRLMPNSAELHFYDNNVLCVKVCLDKFDGLRCEKEGVVVDDVPIWRVRTAHELIEEVRERRLNDTRSNLIEELEQWQLFSNKEVTKTVDGLLIRVKESPKMEVRLLLASNVGHLFQDQEGDGPILSLLRIKNSGWTTPGFDDLRSRDLRRKAMSHLRRGAFLAALLEGSRGRWDKAKEAEFEENRTVVTLVRKPNVDGSSAQVSGYFIFECFEWGIRNVRAGWTAIDFYLPLDLPAEFPMESSVAELGAHFWKVCNAALATLKFDEWDVFLSAAKYNFRGLRHLGDHRFSWEQAVHLHMLKAPLTVDPSGCVSGSTPNLKRPPKCEGVLTHHFPHAVLTVQPAKQHGTFEYRGLMRHFFHDLVGLEQFIDYVERGGITKNVWERPEYALDFPEENHAPAVALRPNEVQWARPFLIGSALEALLKSKGVPAFAKARKQWGPLLKALPSDPDIPYFIFERPPAIVWFFPTATGRRIGAVFQPGHVSCWTKFNKKAFAKCGRGIALIPHLSDGYVGKLARELENFPVIISYLKSFWLLKIIQESRSRRQLRLTQYPPVLTAPSFSFTIVEEDDPFEFVVDFVCGEETIADAAFGLWDSLLGNNEGCVNFLNFLDMMKDTDLVEKHLDDVHAILYGKKIVVDWIARPPEAEKKDNQTILKFYVGLRQVTVQYGAQSFAAFLGTQRIEGKLDSVEALAASVRKTLEEERMRRQVEEQLDTKRKAAQEKQEAERATTQARKDATAMPPPAIVRL
eukprot:GEMP01004937.1.p1 GENE.GEMP01004937.1~~GEMP01004937.1.p1  ORF type:complete len:976 (+),score=214.29 GEMP01004937.1:161-3088(+)